MSGVRLRLRLRSPASQKRIWKSSRRERLTSDSWRYEPELHNKQEEDNSVTLNCVHQLTLFCPLQADIMDVNQIFKDLAVMIHDQGEMIGKSRESQPSTELILHTCHSDERVHVHMKPFLCLY